MRFQGPRLSIEWGHLVVLAAIAGATTWYLLDARSVSTDADNLLLIQPLALVTLLLCLVILPQCFRFGDGSRMEADAPERTTASDMMQPKLPTERLEVIKMVTMGALLGVYVFSLRAVGFDIATFLFVLVGMLVCGERRPLPLAIFPAAVTLVTIYGFKALMPYPMPTTVF